MDERQPLQTHTYFFRQTRKVFPRTNLVVGILIKSVLEKGENFRMFLNEITRCTAQAAEQKAWKATLDCEFNFPRNTGAPNRFPPLPSHDHYRVASGNHPLPEQFQTFFKCLFSGSLRRLVNHSDFSPFRWTTVVWILCPVAGHCKGQTIPMPTFFLVEPGRLQEGFYKSRMTAVNDISATFEHAARKRFDKRENSSTLRV